LADISDTEGEEQDSGYINPWPYVPVHLRPTGPLTENEDALFSPHSSDNSNTIQDYGSVYESDFDNSSDYSQVDRMVFDTSIYAAKRQLKPEDSNSDIAPRGTSSEGTGSLLSRIFANQKKPGNQDLFDTDEFITEESYIGPTFYDTESDITGKRGKKRSTQMSLDADNEEEEDELKPKRTKRECRRPPQRCDIGPIPDYESSDPDIGKVNFDRITTTVKEPCPCQAPFICTKPYYRKCDITDEIVTQQDMQEELAKEASNNFKTEWFRSQVEGRRRVCDWLNANEKTISVIEEELQEMEDWKLEMEEGEEEEEEEEEEKEEGKEEKEEKEEEETPKPLLPYREIDTFKLIPDQTLFIFTIDQTITIRLENNATADPPDTLNNMDNNEQASQYVSGLRGNSEDEIQLEEEDENWHNNDENSPPDRDEGNMSGNWDASAVNTTGEEAINSEEDEEEPEIVDISNGRRMNHLRRRLVQLQQNLDDSGIRSSPTDGLNSSNATSRLDTSNEVIDEGNWFSMWR